MAKSCYTNPHIHKVPIRLLTTEGSILLYRPVHPSTSHGYTYVPNCKRRNRWRANFSSSSRPGGRAEGRGGVGCLSSSVISRAGKRPTNGNKSGVEKNGAGVTRDKLLTFSTPRAPHRGLASLHRSASVRAGTCRYCLKPSPCRHSSERNKSPPGTRNVDEKYINMRVRLN
jgi:hypothetical protein